MPPSCARVREDERTEGNEGEEEHGRAEAEAEALSAEAAARQEEGADPFLQEVEVGDGESSESGLDFVGSREEPGEDGGLVEQQVNRVK